jgi:cyclophilin family peptidyl-prolyl cis-trans isomerase
MILVGLIVSVAPAQEETSLLKMRLVLDKEVYKLGEVMFAEVKLENTGKKDLEVAELIFERRSLSFDILLHLEEQRKGFMYAISNPEAYIAPRVPPNRVLLKQGRSMIQLFRIPAIKKGRWEIVAHYNGWDETVKSNKATVEVKGAEWKNLVANVETTKGTIPIELMSWEAPNTVMNFINLVHKGFYEDLILHRVKKDFVIQTGCPYGLGFGGPGYSIEAEFDPKLKHEVGCVSMSHYEKDNSSGSQFFICLKTLPIFDGKYTMFGKVTDPAGLSIIEEIGKVAVDEDTDKPLQNIAIKRIIITPR